MTMNRDSNHHGEDSSHRGGWLVELVGVSSTHCSDRLTRWKNWWWLVGPMGIPLSNYKRKRSVTGWPSRTNVNLEPTVEQLTGVKT